MAIASLWSVLARLELPSCLHLFGVQPPALAEYPPYRLFAHRQLEHFPLVHGLNFSDELYKIEYRQTAPDSLSIASRFYVDDVS